MKEFKLSNQYIIMNNAKFDKIISSYNGDNYNDILEILKNEKIIKQNSNWIFLYDLKEYEYINSKNENKKIYIGKKIFNNVEYTFAIPQTLIKQSKKNIFYYHNLFNYLKKFIIS